jgi:heptosyltransferase III
MRRLLIRPGAIGDVIVSLPALAFLKADYTEVWTPSAVVPLIQVADKVLSIAASRIDMLPDGFAERLSPFDEIVSWYGSNREILETLHPRIVFHKALPAGELHATDFYARQVGAPLAHNPKIAVQRVARETIVIHPFSGSVRKNWPHESFLELADRLPLPVEWAQDRFENLLELATWMAGARLYIGNDSGITQLAAAVGMPVIALFGPSDPAIWGPRHAKILKDASVNEVLAAANLLLCSR